jgi:hypothetical protein
VERTYRRQLFAFGRLSDDPARVDASARTFIRNVLDGPLALRPNSQGVEDVLSGSGASPVTVARFVAAFDAAVWGTAIT